MSTLSGYGTTTMPGLVNMMVVMMVVMVVTMVMMVPLVLLPTMSLFCLCSVGNKCELKRRRNNIGLILQLIMLTDQELKAKFARF